MYFFAITQFTVPVKFLILPIQNIDKTPIQYKPFPIIIGRRYLSNSFGVHIGETPMNRKEYLQLNLPDFTKFA